MDDGLLRIGGDLPTIFREDAAAFFCFPLYLFFYEQNPPLNQPAGQPSDQPIRKQTTITSRLLSHLQSKQFDFAPRASVSLVTFTAPFPPNDRTGRNEISKIISLTHTPPHCVRITYHQAEPPRPFPPFLLVSLFLLLLPEFSLCVFVCHRKRSSSWENAAFLYRLSRSVLPGVLQPISARRPRVQAGV